MTISFFIDLVIVIALGAMLYLVARTLPRISDESSGGPDLKTSKTLMYLERADQRFKKSREKFFRKFRLILMKLDNHLSNRLTSFKKESDKNGGLKFDLGEEKEEVEKEEDSL